MNGKPKNLSQAIEELEAAAERGGQGFRSRLEDELKNIESTLSKIKPHLEDLQSKVTDEAKKAKDTVETQIHKNPWTAVGLVGLVFFLLGLILGWKGSRRSD